MIIEFVSKNYSPSEKLKDIIIKKLEKLDKFFENDQRAKVMLKESADVFDLELTIPIDGGILRAEVSSDNMYNNIDLAIPKLEKQIIKHHTKIASKSKKFREKMLTEAIKDEQKPMGIVRTKVYNLSPMSVDDAMSELDLIGHNFYVFLNKETNNVSVVYKRLHEGYGLIEAEI